AVDRPIPSRSIIFRLAALDKANDAAGTPAARGTYCGGRFAKRSVRDPNFLPCLIDLGQMLPAVYHQVLIALNRRCVIGRGGNRVSHRPPALEATCLHVEC